MAAFRQDNKNHPIFYNTPRRTQPLGCFENNNREVNNCNGLGQLGNMQDVQNPQLYNNTQSGMHCVPMQPNFQANQNQNLPANQNSQAFSTGQQQNLQQPGISCIPGFQNYPANQNNQTFSTAVASQQFFQPGISTEVQQNFSNQNAQRFPVVQHNYPVQHTPIVNRPVALCTPCNPSTPFINSDQPYVAPQPIRAAPVYPSNVAADYTLPLWNPQSPWSNSIHIGIGQRNVQGPAFSSSFTFPVDRFYPNFNVPKLQSTRSPAPPKSLGKLLFPSLFDFTHDSFFKMLIHMSGFEAININVSANSNSLELKAVKEEIEKQIDDFSGYILKQVARTYHFPEPIEESKIQISISEEVICILIPWKRYA